MILDVVLNMYNSIFYNNNKIRTKLFILHRLMLLLIMLKNIRMELTSQQEREKERSQGGGSEPEMVLKSVSRPSLEALDSEPGPRSRVLRG